MAACSARLRALLVPCFAAACGGGGGGMADGGGSEGASAAASSSDASAGSSGAADESGGGDDGPTAACGGRIVDPMSGAIDVDEYIAQARKWDRDTIDCRLGPRWADVHDDATPDERPDLWEPPVDPAMVCGGDGTMHTYEFGPPSCSNDCAQPSDTFGSVSANVVYLPDDDNDPGVDRVLTHAWEMQRVAVRPQPATGGSHPDPDLASSRWPSLGFADPHPFALARAPFAGNWANQAMTLFRDGFVGPLGTRTDGVPGGSEVGFRFPDNLAPTAVAMTTMNELALVTLWDTDDQTGKLAVFAMHGNFPANGSSTWWYVGLPNGGGFSAMKLLGYIDLPIATPTSISAVSNGYRDSPHDHWVMGLGDIPLIQGGDCLADAATHFDHGGDLSHIVAANGYAVIASRWEHKVVFVDLAPWFAWLRSMYFEDDARCDAEVGPVHVWNCPDECNPYPTHFDGDDVFPYPFSVVPEATPQVAAVIDVESPRDVFAGLQSWKIPADDPDPPKAWVLGADGTLHVYSAAGLVTRHPDDVRPDEPPSELAAIPVCEHPTTLASIKGGIDLDAGRLGGRAGTTISVNGRNSGALVVCRGDRMIQTWATRGSEYTKVGELQDRAMGDPVAIELSMRGPIWSVADFDGRAVVNYQTGDIVGTGCAETNVTVMPTGDIRIQRGGALALPGPVYLLSSTNVN
ncbi:MAG TPA: hypothetical protein VG755_20070 [Nannocystaceae bacterium]|nr:hypothetical protein [Nannocystaceae bacterium]